MVELTGRNRSLLDLLNEICLLKFLEVCACELCFFPLTVKLLTLLLLLLLLLLGVEVVVDFVVLPRKPLKYLSNACWISFIRYE